MYVVLILTSFLSGSVSLLDGCLVQRSLNLFLNSLSSLSSSSIIRLVWGMYARVKSY